MANSLPVSNIGDAMNAGTGTPNNHFHAFKMQQLQTILDYTIQQVKIYLVTLHFKLLL
jgi:hypothetical protein